MSRKLLCVLLVLILALTAMTAVACDKDEPIVLVPIDACEYYLESAESSYKLSIGNDNTFTFKDGSTTFTGGYVVNGKALTLTTADGAVLTLNIGDNTATLKYGEDTYTLYLKVEYTVSFDVDGGTNVADQDIFNGSKATKPADITKDGYKFLGWYDSDSFKTNFDFDQPITANTTVYANFVEIIGDEEFTISFDYGDFDDVDTTNGQLFNIDMPTPADKDGFTFGGWWVSNTNDADELSYAWTEGLVFAENTTLYPLWVKATTGNKVEQQIVTLTETGFEWNGSSKATSGYLVAVTGPEGFKAVNETVNTNSYELNWAGSLAGNYTISVTALASNEENNSDTTTLVYTNKALARVSLFEIDDQYTLKFNTVENATEYFITVECNDPTHADHENLSLGNRNTYDFSACDMPQGGAITFTITAHATGYADSTAVYVLDRALDAAENATITDELLTWDEVELATGYTLTVKGGDIDYTAKLDADTFEYDLKYLDLDNYELTLAATAKGYNNGTTTLAFNKTTLATPDDLYAIGSNLEWTAIKDAVSYELTIDGEAFTANTNTLEWPDSVELKDADYAVKVRAVGENGEYSLWGEYVISGKTEPTNLAYGANTFTWSGVLGADGYEVVLNDGSAVETTDRKYAVTFTQAGENTLKVRSYTGTEYSEWVTLNVTSYELTFDTTGGSDVDTLYLATGDTFTADTTTLLGYDFAGWYDGGSKYTDEFEATDDLELTAKWTSKEYTITYDAGEGYLAEDTGIVKYGQNYTLGIPSTPEGLTFIGWYAGDDGTTLRNTNELGESLRAWNIADNATMYAFYAEALEFIELNDGTLSVTRGPEIGLIENLLIPAEVDGVKVTVVEGYAFFNCNRLKTITMYNSIDLVELETAFYSCSNIEAINVIELEGEKTVNYFSHSGVLYAKDDISNEISVGYVPTALSGEVELLDITTVISDKAFAGYANITKVTIPSSVTYIGEFAFNNCANLAELVFEDGENPLEIGSNAFNNCQKLTSLTLPSRLTVFNANMLNGCSNMANIGMLAGSTLYSTNNGVLYNADGSKLLYYPAGRVGTFAFPSNVTKIGSYAFSYNSSLTTITLPSSIQTIEDYAFANSVGLTSVTFEADSTNATIGNYAFLNCRRLFTLTFDEDSDIVSIGEGAFSGCSALATLDIPATVTSIGNKAFYDCTRLTKVNFPENGEEVTFGSAAFGGCTALTTIYLPSTVTDIEFAAFTGCTGLVEVTVAEANANYTSVEGVLYNKAKTSIVYYPQGLVGEYELPDSVVTIPDSAFKGSGNLTGITIPGSVVEIAARAFNGCYSLLSVTFGEGTEDLIIGDSAFADCSSLLSINLPERVTELGTGSAGVFVGCKSLIEAHLPSSLTVIHPSTFSTCNALTTVNIPEGVTDIGAYAFAQCVKLDNVELPDGLKTIGNYAFMMCSALRELVIPKTLTLIGAMAYMNSGLVTIDYEEGGTEPLQVGYDPYSAGMTFQQCALLKTVRLPARMTTLDQMSFSNCQKLESVEFEADSKLGEISSSLFQGCWSLKTVNIPENIIAIGDYAFQNTGIVSVKLPNTLQNHEIIYWWGGTGFAVAIGSSAFATCNSLVSVEWEDLDEDTKDLEVSLGANAFAYCQALESVQLPSNMVSYITDWGTEEQGLPAGTFMDDKSLANITVHEGGEYSAVNNVIYSNEGNTIYLVAPVNTGDFTIANTVEAIDDYAFAYSNLTNVYFEDGDTEITFGSYGSYSDPYTFANSNIKSIVFSNRVTTIPRNGCYRATSLVSVYIPKTVTQIEYYAFCACKELEFVTFEEDSALTYIDSYAFSSCYKLKALNIDEDTPLEKIGYAVFDDSAIESFVVPASVTWIEDNTFSHCENFASITFTGNKITNIDNYAFRGTALTSITIPEGVTSLGANLFDGCEHLTTVNLPSTINSLLVGASNLFSGCSALTTVNVAAPTTADEDNLPYAKSIDGVVYSYDGTKLLYFPQGRAGDVVVPTGVTTIGEHAFNGNTNITSVTLPDTLTSIEQYAFNNCANLATVTFEDNSEDLTIGNYAFAATKALSSITLPANLTEIGAYVFQNSALSNVTFDEGSKLETIGNFAFHTTAITTFTLPDSVTTIGDYAFGINYNLSEFNIGEESHLSIIGYNAFYGAYRLKDIALPMSLTDIGHHAFANSGLTAVALPANILNVGINAFENCGSLESADITTLDVVPAYMFYNCQSLETVKLPADTTEIGSYAFYDCKALHTINLPDGLISIGSYAFANNNELESIALPDTLTLLGDGVFSGSGLTAIVVPNKVTAIPNYAFNDCSALTDATMSNNVTTIGSHAFAGCVALEDIILSLNVINIGDYAYSGVCLADELFLPVSLNTIGDYAFKGCAGLSEIRIPSNVYSLGRNPFSGCTAFTDVEVDFGSVDYAVVDGVLYSGDFSTLISYPAGKTGEYIVNENVTAIASYAFAGCTKLTDVTLPASLKTIETGAFSGCTALTDIDLPHGLVSIGHYAFEGTGLTSIYIPNTVLDVTSINYSETNLGQYAFANCPDLVTVEFENSLVGRLFIGNYAFYNCPSLESVNIPAHVYSVCQSYSAKYSGIGIGVFMNCPSLDTVTFTEGGTKPLTLGNYAFYGCTSLAAITLPDRVTDCAKLYSGEIAAIGAYAFAECTSLATFNYNYDGATVVNLGEFAFYNCEALTSFTMHDDVANMYAYTFAGSGLTSFVMPEAINNLYEGIFMGCEDLVSVDISEVYNVTAYLFADCTSLETVITNGSVGSILEKAFMNCSSLTSIDIDQWVASITEDAFMGCSSLTEFIVIADHEDLSVIDGVLYNKDQTKLIFYPAGKTGETFTVPSSVTEICGLAFHGSQLTTIVLGDDTAALVGNVFAGCDATVTLPAENENFTYKDGVLFSADMTKLYSYPAANTATTYTVPNSVTEIADYAFYNASNLTSVVLPEGLFRIGAHVFEGCSELTTLVLPASLEQLGDWAFFGCDKLTGMSVATGNTKFAYQDDVLTGPSGWQVCVFFCSPTKTGEYTTAAEVNCISYGAFANCTGITKVTVTNSSVYLKRLVFSGWTAAQTISFPTRTSAPASYQWLSTWNYNSDANVVFGA